VVQADVLEADEGGIRVEHPGEAALESDRHVAQADRAMALLEQCAGHDSDRVREVDDPGAGLRMPAHGLGDLEHTGTVRSALASPPGPVVS
jgi:hypothetical protein